MNTRVDPEHPCPDCGFIEEEAVDCGMNEAWWQCTKCGCQKNQCDHSPVTTGTEGSYETVCQWCGILLGED